VGAGLPVIATLNRLIASGDEITRMAGTFSGTLGYLMTGLQEGRPFSEVVREAHKLGYTEPDPRDDLGGVDVARKALILARGLGWRLDMADVAVTGLYPAAMADLSVAEFMAALPDLDAHFSGLVADAAADGKVLRFAATVEDGACQVGPVAVSADSPLGRLSGTDNLIEITSRWYQPNPLVIQGRGAGVDATAAGVLSDIVELAFTR
jgi:homoserine dehydrogenase